MHTVRLRPTPEVSIPPTPTDSDAGSSTTTTLAPARQPAQPAPSFLPTPISASTPVAKPARGPASLQVLPRNILAEIGYHLVVDEQGVGRHPKHLLALLLTCKQICYAIDFDHHPQLYNSLFRATFDWVAIQRRYNWMKQHLSSNSKGAPKTFDLFEDPRAWGTDYKNRWDLARRSKLAPTTGDITPEEKEQYAADLWTYWFLLTENDGKNYTFLMGQLDMYGMFWHYFQRFVLPQSRLPGYPPDDGLTALGMWCALISGADVRRPYNAQHTDEKLFWLRPYIFACFKYDISYAPWQQRQLPLCHPQCREHELDITMQSKALPYKRFGYTWRRAPPHFVLGAYLSLLRTMERHQLLASSDPSSTGGNEASEGLFSSYQMISSLNHDREWQRNSVCQDPHTSFGLPPLAFHHEVEGFWRGKFIHYPLEMYRKILQGDLRTLYTGEFSLQPMEIEIKETVIKVRKDEVGGGGNALDAGFDAHYADPDREQERIRAGYGHPLADIDEPDEEGWTKEILLSGKAQMVLGPAYVRGRIRPWDGLVLLVFKNESMDHAMSKFIWRGYIHTGGYLIGRWRDTFTPANFRGFEGGFVLVKAGSHVYPPSFPVRMTESLVPPPTANASSPQLWAQANPDPIGAEVEFTPLAQHAHPGQVEPERGSSRDSIGTATGTRSSIASSSTTLTGANSPESPKQDWAWHGSAAVPDHGPSPDAPQSSTATKRARSASVEDPEEADRKGKGKARDM